MHGAQRPPFVNQDSAETPEYVTEAHASFQAWPMSERPATVAVGQARHYYHLPASEVTIIPQPQHSGLLVGIFAEH